MNKIFSDIIICDDHYISAVGLKSLLNNIFSGKTQTRLASNANETLMLFHEREPDLLLLDLGLPEKSGLELLKELLHYKKKCMIIIMTGADDPILFQQVLKQGVQALLRKSNSDINLREALNFISERREGVYVDSSVACILKEELGIPLTRREFDVIELMSKGHTSQEIADLINCSLSTIKTYRMRIMNKIGARNSSEMIAWFLKKRSC